MPIKSLYQGNAFDICGWKDERGNCPVEDFFEELGRTGHKDLDTMLNLMERSAERGPPRNIEMSRVLEGKRAEGLLEFKAGSIRVIWFYDHQRIIICTHGFLKKGQKTPPGDIEKAQETRRRYYAE